MRPETVGSDIVSNSVDPLLRKQREDVAKMRASLLACSDDPSSTVTAIRNITVLRIYHQISRIIRYLDMMDKIEDKLYRSIDNAMDRMDEDSPVTWMTLMNIQERLQKNIIDSHKLLQPYLNIEEFGMNDLTVSSTTSDNRDMIISRESRDRLRISAQQVLEALDTVEEVVE